MHAALDRSAARGPAAAARRGRALGRPVDPRAAQLPVLPRLRRRRRRSSRPTAATTCTAGTRCAPRSPSGPGCPASTGSSSSRSATPTSAPLVARAAPGRRCPSATCARIVERAEGNAFFTEELVGRRPTGASRSLPDDLADLLLVRLDQLDDAARQAVRAAVGAGRRVPHELLAARRRPRPAPTLDAGAARRRRAATSSCPVGADSYAFRHALLAEAVYDDLLPGERVRLHAAYAVALRERRVRGTAAELARHARAAHDLATAVQASIEAGDEAMSVGGPDEAARHYEVALELRRRRLRRADRLTRSSGRP